MPTPCRRAALPVLVAVATLAPALPASALVRTTLTLTPRAVTVPWRAPVHLRARLSDPLGAVSGATVVFYDRVGSRPWHRVAQVRTDGDGYASLTRRLSRSTRWQARYAGGLVRDAGVSPVSTVRVLPPPKRTRVPFGRRVVREAARHRGAPYQYGAAGPRRFDCSGFTMYVFGRFHVSLPHNAAAQWDRTRHVARSRKRLGDLVFFYDGGGIYHVGIYAGHGRMWAATHTGDVVRLESIYSASYLVGRVHAPASRA